MPWPYISARNSSSSSKSAITSPARSGTLDDIDRNHGGGRDHAFVGGLSLEEEEGTSNTARRGASLDLPRASLNALTPFTTSLSNNDQKAKARRSSFPRLALPSWRQSPPSSPSSSKLKASGTSSPSSKSIRSTTRSRPTSLALDDRASDEDGEGVELQEGYGTPYTATGLKGGFQCTTNNLSGSSSIASTSSSSRKSHSSKLFSLLSSGSASTRTSSDEYSLESPFQHEHEQTANKGDDDFLNRRENIIPSSKPAVLPADSGFSEFGPHSIVEEEERRQSLSSADHRYSSASAVNSDDDENQGTSSRDGTASHGGSGGSNVTIPKKARSRGWFSFNSSTSVPTSKTDISTAGASIEDSTNTPTNERDTSLASSGAVSIAETHSTGSSNETTTGTPVPQASAAGTTSSTSQAAATNSANGKKTKQGTTGKGGFSIMRSAGRKRGDSEVSMKEMTTLS